MFDIPKSSQNNDWDLPDKASSAASYTREHMAENSDYCLRALRAQTGSRHFKGQVAISIYFIQAIPILDSV